MKRCKCGREPLIATDFVDDGWWVECPEPGCGLKVDKSETEEEAIEKWNSMMEEDNEDVDGTHGDR